MMMHLERWSLLIIGEALLRDVTRSSDFERNLLIDRKTLESRLQGLINSGLMDRRSASDPNGEAEFELTDKGRDLEGVIEEVSITWGKAVFLSPIG